MLLRPLTWFLSLALHAGVAWHFMQNYEPRALAAGTGEDEFYIEQGIVLEGVATLGFDSETVRQVQSETMEVSEVRPEVQEAKAVEAEEEPTNVITSETGPEQEALPETVEEVQEQKTQVATAAEVPDVVVEEKQAAGAAQHGGDATAVRAYQGKLFAHLKRRVVRPVGGARAGKVWVRFTIDPSGQLLSREVAKSSGIARLDEAALATIDKAAPFPPFPTEVGTGPRVETVPINYRIE